MFDFKTSLVKSLLNYFRVFICWGVRTGWRATWASEASTAERSEAFWIRRAKRAIAERSEALDQASEASYVILIRGIFWCIFFELGGAGGAGFEASKPWNWRRQNPEIGDPKPWIWRSQNPEIGDPKPWNRRLKTLKLTTSKPRNRRLKNPDFGDPKPWNRRP